jgi:hypothetical protein
LCDAPTGALDYLIGKIVPEVIGKINREIGSPSSRATRRLREWQTA